MLRLILLGFLLSLVFVSGCVEQELVDETGTLTESQLEEADGMIEQEMEDAIENIDLEELENLILE